MGRRLGATPLQVSLLVAAPAIVLLLSLWIVNAVRPVHPVQLVIWPSLVGRAMFLLMPFAQTPVPYLVLVVLFHAASSINTLGYAQVMRAVYPDNVRGRIMALVKIGMATSWVLASLLGGQLTQIVPFQWVFAVGGVLGMASGVVFSRIRPPERLEIPEPIDPAVAWRLVREDGAYRRFLMAFFIYGFGGWLISPAIPLLLVDELHASNFQVGLLGAVMAAMWTISFYSWGAMIDRRSATDTLKVVFTIGALTPVIYLLAPSAWIVQLAGVTDGLTSAGIDLGWLAAALHYAPQGQVLHYVTLFNTSVGIRGATAPFITGTLIPLIGVRWIFAIGASSESPRCVLPGAGAPAAPGHRTGPRTRLQRLPAAPSADRRRAPPGDSARRTRRPTHHGNQSPAAGCLAAGRSGAAVSANAHASTGCRRSAGEMPSQIVEECAEVRCSDCIEIAHLRQRRPIDLQRGRDVRHHGPQRLHVGLDVFLPGPCMGHGDDKPAMPVRSWRDAAFCANHTRHLSLAIGDPFAHINR